MPHTSSETGRRARPAASGPKGTAAGLTFPVGAGTAARPEGFGTPQRYPGIATRMLDAPPGRCSSLAPAAALTGGRRARHTAPSPTKVHQWWELPCPRLPGRPTAGSAACSRKLCYCETVRNLTVSVPDDVYRNARVAAAQRDTSVSALVVAYLERLSGWMEEFGRLEALQREVQAEIGQFRAADRLGRDEVHDRAVR